MVRDLSSVELIVIDPPRVDDDLIAATRPMLAVSNSSLFALTTPAGKRGWFYEQWLSRDESRLRNSLTPFESLSLNWGGADVRPRR